MDTDAFAMVHRAEWDRLDALAARRKLTGPEVDELVDLYQRCATHLSQVASTSADPAMVLRLSRTVARGRAAISTGSTTWLKDLARIFTVSFPAAVWRVRWLTVACAVGTLVVSAAVALWVASSPEVLAQVGGDGDLSRYVDYYHQDTSASFSANVWTNNARVAALCFALGITGIGVIDVLISNAINVGVGAGLMLANGQLGLFFALITPHGLLELTAVFIAAAAGLRLFWAWVVPGPMSRGESLGREGRSMVSIVIGLVVVLFVSGIVEGFVTPSPLPTPARVAIGAVIWMAFLAYVWHFGRQAVAAGETGDLDPHLRDDIRPTTG